MENYSIKVLETQTSARAFTGMTFPKFKGIFNQIGLKSNCIGIGIYLEHIDKQIQPVGFVLGYVHPESPEWGELLSVYVSPQHRFRGLAKKGIKSLIKQMQSFGVRRMDAVYSNASNSYTYLESIFSNLGFSDPVTRMYLYQASSSVLLKADWMPLFEKLPAGFKIIPWKDISSEQRKGLSKLISNEGNLITPDVVPFLHETEGMDKSPPIHDLCFACIHDNDLVGWHFTHRVNPELGRFSCSFVLPGHREQVPLLSLWIHAFRNMESLGHKKITWGIYPYHVSMLEFTQKMMLQYVDQQSESRAVSKEI